MRSTTILAAILALSAGLCASTPWVARAQPTPGGGAPEPKTSSLSWTRLDGAEACIPTRELAQMIEGRLGRSVFVSAADADLSVEGRVEPVVGSGVRWRSVIVVSDAGGVPLGTREIESQAADCRALDDQVALAIALMIDPDAALGPPAAPPPPPPAPEPTVIVQTEPVYIPVPVPPPPPPPAPPEEEPWRWDVRAGPMLGFGVLPDVALGLQGGVTIEPPWFIAIEGSVGLWLPQSEAVGTAHVETSSAYVAGAICPLTPRSGAFGFDGCLESQLGFLRVRGLDFAVDKDQLEPLLNAGLRARVNLRVSGPLVAGGSVAGAVPLLRDRFVYRDETGNAVDAFRIAPVVFTPEVHMGLRFP